MTTTTNKRSVCPTREMYQKTIRMNAENGINSWNLSLIDHLDRFLTIPEETSSNTRLVLPSTLQKLHVL
jgi:hypothetical protein